MEITQKNHQICLGINSAAATPGNSGGNPNAGDNCTVTKPQIPNKTALTLSICRFIEDAYASNEVKIKAYPV